MISIPQHTGHLTAIFALLIAVSLCSCMKEQEDAKTNPRVVWRLNPSPGAIVEPSGISGPDGIQRQDVHILIGVQNDSEVELTIDSVIVFDSVRTNVLPATFEGVSSAVTYRADSFNWKCRGIPPKSWRMASTLCYRPVARLYLRALGVQIYTNHGNVTERVDSLLALPDRVRVLPVRTRDVSISVGVIGS